MSTSVSGLSTNFFPSAENGFTTTTSGSVSSGATTVGLASVAGYSNGEVAVFVIDPTDVAKKQTFTGVIDTAGTQVTSVKWTAGTNQTHALGATVVDYATATHISMMTKGITQEHNQDGTHGAVTATSLVSAGAVTGTTLTGTSLVNTGDVQLRSQSLETIRSETEFDYVASGGVWSGDSYGSTLAASMSAVTCYINGRRGTISAVTARAFTASKDTYIDILNNSGTFSLVYTEVTNNAASPALAANSVRIGIIVSGGSSIANVAAVNQGQEDKVLPIASSIAYTVTDSLGNLIYPRDPQRKLLGLRRITSDFSTTNSSATTITGLTVPVIVPTNRKIKITVHGYKMSNGSSPVNTVLGIWDTSTSGTNIGQGFNTSGGSNYASVASALSIVTPTSASKTYVASLHQNGGGTSTFAAAATAPGYIMVELA